MSSRLDLPDRLHESVPNDDADVGPRVAVRFACELPQVGVAQAVRRVAEMKSEHVAAGLFLRKRDVNPLLKSETTDDKFSWFKTKLNTRTCEKDLAMVVWIKR